MIIFNDFFRQEAVFSLSYNTCSYQRNTYIDLIKSYIKSLKVNKICIEKFITKSATCHAYASRENCCERSHP